MTEFLAEWQRCLESPELSQNVPKMGHFHAAEFGYNNLQLTLDG